MRPVCLPANVYNTYTGEKAIATGWGTVSFGGEASSVLQEVKIDVWSNQACSLAYSGGVNR